MSFDINFFSRRHHYHRYSSDDFALKSIGIANYTTSSAESLFKTKPPNPDLVEFFGSLEDTKKKILGIGSESSFEIMEFDPKERKYKSVTGLSEILQLDPEIYKAQDYATISVSKVEDFLENWDKIALGIIEDKKTINAYQAISYKIQNSLSGCILFNAGLTVLGDSRNVKIRLALSDYKDSESDRTISFRGSPLITAVPETADGLQHGFRPTNASPPGVYVPPANGDTNNPQNTVSSNLRLSYDSSTGKFESGTQQILVRLTTNIDAANVGSFKSSELLSLTRSDIYDEGVEGAGYMGDFKIGSGVPLSKENGNPYLYGPNFVGNCETQKPRVIQVVNRSGKTFRDGDLVMCSLINGEWLPMEFGGAGFDPNKKNLSFGSFEYGYFIIPAKDYFTVYKSYEMQQARCLPDTVATNIRNDFYLKLSDYISTPEFGSNVTTINNIDTLKQLNIFASNIPQDAIDPVDYIYQNFNNINKSEMMNNANENSISLDYFNMYQNYIKPDPNCQTETLSSQYAIPKNIESKNARKVIAYNAENNNSPDTSIDVLRGVEVPFWGMLFPDGYKSEQCAQFIIKNPDINKIPVFANDPNLRELSVLATLGVPDLKDPVKHMQTYDITFLKNPLSVVRKNAGVIRRFIVNTLSRLYSILSYDANIGKNYIYEDLNRFLSPIGIYGLEPLKPNRLQFSSMSLEFLYSQSYLENALYNNLNSSVNFIKEFRFKSLEDTPSWMSARLISYNNVYLADFNTSPSNGTNVIDAGNIYSDKSLSIDESFPSQATAIRHIGPLGTVADLLPSIYDYRRSIVMPVLTCKSYIKTSAESLEFNTKQNIGMSPKLTISVGFGPQIFYTPLGFGMTWQESPAIPSSQQSTPQWGDRNRSDDIDSFGTTALHARVFEAWPIDQTIFLGGWFTPLHFNPAPQQYQKEVVYEGNPPVPVLKDKLVTDKNKNKVKVETISPVDFRVPTRKNGGAMSDGEIVGSGTLAPVSEWEYNKIRRGMLLSKGGFAYERNIVGVDTSSIKIKPPSGQTNYNGAGYIVGDKFRFSDGTTIEVASTGENGSIVSFKEAIQGRNPPGYTSWNPNIQPAYLGSTGQGARFDEIKLKVVKVYAYDPPPKEVVPITRLTKKSDPKNAAEGNNVVNVDLKNESGKSKGYDIFYFFHNDPSHYSIDYTNPFNGGWAQYVICEVNGA